MLPGFSGCQSFGFVIYFHMIDTAFEKFHTELGFAMKLIKHQSEDADEIIMQTNHRKFSPETAYFLKSAMKLNLEFEEEEGGIDMCKSLEKKEKKDRILGAIDYMKDEGKSEEEIIARIISKYNVTKEYVLTLLKPQVA